MDRARLDHFIGRRLSELTLAPAVYVTPSDSVRTAVERMREAGQSCVLTGEGGRLTGIFTERDVLSKCMEQGFDWDQPVQAILTPDPRSIASESTVADAIAIMHERQYRTLPVVDGGQVMGIIRAGDIVTNLAEAYPEDVLNLPPRPHQVMEKREGG